MRQTEEEKILDLKKEQFKLKIESLELRFQLFKFTLIRGFRLTVKDVSRFLNNQ